MISFFHRDRVGLLVLVIFSGLSRIFASTSALVCDQGYNAVRAYTVADTNWTYTGVFATGLYDGQPLTTPLAIAQDAAKNIYIAETSANGRVMRFDTNGVYLGSLGTNGVQFSGSFPQALTIGPNGNLYMSLAFGTTASNCVYRCNLSTKIWSVFIPNSGSGYSLNNPRGLAFASDGNLYVADRNNNVIRKFNGSTGAYISNLAITVPSASAFPQGLAWDAANTRLLATMTSSSDVYAYTLAGVGTLLYKGSEYCLDVQPVDGQVAFTRYTSGRTDLVIATNASLPVATLLKNPGHLQSVLLAPRAAVPPPTCPALPGTQIAYSPASTVIYLGSPAITILPNGNYLASHDYFGGGSSQSTLGQTFLYLSTNRGTNWTLLGQINQMVSGAADTNGCFWNHFFQLNGALYSIANPNGNGGPTVIRRSTNNGALWTSINSPPDNTGRLFASQSWDSGQSSVLKYGRIWMDAERAQSSTFGDNFIAALSAPTNADLLSPANWSLSTTVMRNTNWLGGTFSGWLEGNCLQDTNGGLVLMMRVDNRYANGAAIGSKAALIRVNYLGSTNATTSFSGGNFDPADPNGNGFVDFPGGCTRFTVRFDSVSQKYWTLCNYIPRAFRNNAYNAERFRAILALASSPNLRDWTVERFVMFDDRLYSSDGATVAAAFNSSSIGYETAYGFQYADWQFDGNDLVATVRTAFCDNFGGAHSGHDANYYLFTRVTNFRSNHGPLNVRINSLQYSRSSGAAQIIFSTRASYLYKLQISSDLQNWTDTGASLEGSGADAVFSLSGQNAAIRFYRIAESTSWLP